MGFKLEKLFSTLTRKNLSLSYAFKKLQYAFTISAEVYKLSFNPTPCQRVEKLRIRCVKIYPATEDLPICRVQSVFIFQTNGRDFFSAAALCMVR